MDDGTNQKSFAAAQHVAEARDTHEGTGEVVPLIPLAEVSSQPVGYQRRIGPAQDPGSGGAA